MGWNVELFNHLMGHDKTEEMIEQLGRIKVGNDLLIWLPNLDGKFSTSSA